MIDPIKLDERPGWVVDILVISQHTLYATTIYGAKDREDAERNALRTFSNPADLRIIKAEPV